MCKREEPGFSLFFFIMAYIRKPVNDLLCYVSSARDALTQDHIILNSFAHYGAELIKKGRSLSKRPRRLSAKLLVSETL